MGLEDRTESRRGGWLGRLLSLPSVVDDFEFEVSSETVLPLAASPQGVGELPVRGLTASAAHITKRVIERKIDKGFGSLGKTVPWQDEAWEMLDHVGEQRFLANTLAGRMSQAALYVGTVDEEDSPGTAPLYSDDPVLNGFLDSIGDGVAGLSQLVYRAGVNLFVAGEVWLVGIPRPLFERVTGASEPVEGEQVRPLVNRSLGVSSDEAVEGYDVEDMVWRMFSVSEIQLTVDDRVQLTISEGEEIVASPDDLWLIRIWRPHPRRGWEADSPTRASLPVLRELVGLTMHISAQLDSRLAGAGMLLFSQEASSELKRQSGIPGNDAQDPFINALTDAMTTPIQDRSSASAVVPLVVTVPDVDKAAKHISFATPLDKESRELRDEAIRRLALGQDAPPEILLGSGGMNHWGAWLVREDTVTTHLEPPLALLCDALTSQFLRPLMRATNFDEDTISRTVVWFDVDHLVTRPNRTQDAKDLYAVGAISQTALRDATGFENSDAPSEDVANVRDRAVEKVLDMVSQAPSLAGDPGIAFLVEQVEAVMGGSAIPPVSAPKSSLEEGGGGSPDSIPQTDSDPMVVPNE